MEINKKGASQLIAVIILILIGLTVAVIIFNFARGFVEKQKEETEGFNFYYDVKIRDVEISNSEMLFQTGYSYVGGGDSIENEANLLGVIKVAVERIDNEGYVKGVRFVFYSNDGSSYSYDGEALNEAGVVKFYEINNRDLGISSFSEIEKVSIMLLYGEGKATEVLDEMKIE